MLSGVRKKREIDCYGFYAETEPFKSFNLVAFLKYFLILYVIILFAKRLKR